MSQVTILEGVKKLRTFCVQL